MTGLVHVACARCGTVAAVPTGFRECPRCRSDRLETLSPDGTAGAYFSRGLETGG